MPKYNPLPNLEAISHLDKKTLLESYHYLDILAHEHAVAFTVAKMMDKDLLAEIKQALLEAMENGTDFNTFQKRLKPYLMAKGWWGEQVMTDPKDGKSEKVQLGSTRRLRTIYHTNKHTAYAAGQWQRIQENKETFPYLQYTASVAGNPRKDHKKYYNLVLPVDHPIWQYIFPPNGWGCLCGVRQLTKAQAEAIGITEDFDAEWEIVENPRTNQKVVVPKDIDVSFAHNHGDRLGKLIELAEEKHGAEFVKEITDKLDTIASEDESLQELVSRWVTSDKYEHYETIYEDSFDKLTYPLSKSEFMALRYYTSNGYEELNKYLNGFSSGLDEETAQGYKNIRELLKQALSKLPAYNGKVIRRLELTDEQLEEYNLGAEIVYNAFSSTTARKKDVVIAGKGNVRLVITSKTGRKIQSISEFADEIEVLFAPPTHFEVIGITKKAGYTEITLEEL